VAESQQPKARPMSKTALREMRVLKLRAKGLGFDEIAAKCGYANRSSAWKAYKRALTSSDRAMTDEHHRTLELHRLELLNQAIWPAASRGDLSAVREAARLSRDRVKLLGLSIAPGRTNGKGEDDGDDEGVVIGSDRLDAMRERRARDAAERTSRT